MQNNNPSNNKVKVYSIVQLNHNRSRPVHDLVHQLVSCNHFNVLLGQEQNKKTKVMYSDKRNDCFINIYDSRIENRFCDEGFVVVETEDISFVSCYFSPNRNNQDFSEFLYRLSCFIHSTSKPVVIGGDMNAKTAAIGSAVTNDRGEMLEDWIASCHLVVGNVGNNPTFRGGRGSSVIDVTLYSENASVLMSNWRLLDNEELLSDHLAMAYKVTVVESGRESHCIYSGVRWIWTDRDMGKFAKNGPSFVSGKNGSGNLTPETLMSSIERFCEANLKPAMRGATRKPAYWWNSEVEAARRKCIYSRRKYTRERSPSRRDGLKNELKTAQKALKKAIMVSKRNKWNELCEDIDRDPWGLGYKIVTKKLNLRNSKAIDETTMKQEVKKLFPEASRTGSRPFDLIGMDLDGTDCFDESDLRHAVLGCKKKKSAGPDGIRPEIIEALINCCSTVFLDVYNWCLKSGVFPTLWKRARLVLLEKPKKSPNDPVKYRPICIIDAAGKFLERLINDRISKEIQEKNMLHRNQFGFRKGLSTLNAVAEVKKFVAVINAKATNNREFAVMILVDVANAFNSAPWGGILQEMERKGLSPYLIRIINSYLSDRELLLPNGECMAVTCGVPQGSVLGPTLWNLFYDQVLELPLEEGVEAVAYADDIAVLVKAKTVHELREKSTFAMKNVLSQLSKMGLRVAPEKTEVLIVAGRRTLRFVEIPIDEVMIASTECVKYLGVYIGRNLNMATHIKEISQKAARVTRSLDAIMPRVGGPRPSKRRLLASTVLSIVLYAAPQWCEALRFAYYKKILDRINRRLAIKIASAYRTVSGAAVEVIAGLPPLDLRVMERSIAFEELRSLEDLRAETFRVWQSRWDQYDGWTKIFVPDVRKWCMRRFGSVTYHVTQALTGHGVFGAYLKRIGRQATEDCWYCGRPDTPRHTFFECERFIGARIRASLAYGGNIDEDSVGSALLESEESWAAITGWLTEVMMIKQREEQRRMGLGLEHA